MLPHWSRGCRPCRALRQPRVRRVSALSGAFEARDLSEENRRERKGQAKEQLEDEERAELTVVGRRLNGTGGLVTHFPTDHVEFVHVFGAELAQRQGRPSAAADKTAASRGQEKECCDRSTGRGA